MDVKALLFEREHHCYLLEARKEINDHFKVIDTIIVVVVVRFRSYS